MIKIDNISKHFGQKIAVRKLSLEILPGELFAFLGPNGAGKTTTIKMLVGLLQPTAGSVCICGHSMANDYIQAKQCIAYVPDQPYLYDKLSGREFLQFVGQMYGMGKAELQKEMDYLIDLFELSSYIDTLCENYSHGMKQRVIFSSALLHSPKVLVIDEPMVGLDPKSAKIVKNVLKEQTAQGTTVFMSTHSLEVAEETATRIGIINLGSIIALGTLEELQQKLTGKTRLEDIFLELTV